MLYESQRLLGEYLLLHYGNGRHLPHAALTVSNMLTEPPFPVRCVNELLDVSMLPNDATALELGCSVGASSFELCRTCSRVEASDYSNSFITAARMLQKEGRLETDLVVEGLIREPFVAEVPAGIDRERVNFSVADATDLPSTLGNFDVVLAANLICRLADPDKFLTRTASLVKPGGQLLLTTPFTWLEDFTPLNRWIGGFDQLHRSEEELKCRLAGEFQLHRRRDLPFLIREHERKYQLGIALGTSWIRK